MITPLCSKNKGVIIFMLLEENKKPSAELKMNYDKSKKQLGTTILFKISVVINLVTFLSIFILTSILSPNSINNFFHSNPDAGYQFYSIKLFLIIILILLLISASLVVAIAYSSNLNKINDNIFVFSFLAIFSFN